MGIRLRAKHYSKKITFVSGAILMLVGGLFFVNQALADATKPAAKAGEKLVTIYDRGAEKTIVTKARTIREALKLAKFSIDERQDVVEPSLDSEMVAEKYSINIFRARPITIVDGNKRLKVTTAEQTPALIAKAAGIEVFEEDKTTLSNSDNMAVDGANMVMKIDRASMVNFVLYGKESVIRTHAKTVGELLKEKNIDPKKDDTLSVDRSAKIIPGMKIELWRNGKQTITAEEDVKFEVEKVQDANRDSGYREVKQAGENGKKNVTYEVEMKNGVEVSRKEIASVVTKEPKKQIEIIGTKPKNPLTKSKGAQIFTDSKGVAHRETYYDLPMNIVIKACGSGGTYTVRADGAKVDKDGYILVAANYGNYPRCSVVETSMGPGKVYDTGGFAAKHPHGFDLATDWTNGDGR